MQNILYSNYFDIDELYDLKVTAVPEPQREIG